MDFAVGSVLAAGESGGGEGARRPTGSNWAVDNILVYLSRAGTCRRAPSSVPLASPPAGTLPTAISASTSSYVIAHHVSGASLYMVVQRVLQAVRGTRRPHDKGD